MIECALEKVNLKEIEVMIRKEDGKKKEDLFSKYSTNYRRVMVKWFRSYLKEE